MADSKKKLLLTLLCVCTVTELAVENVEKKEGISKKSGMPYRIISGQYLTKDKDGKHQIVNVRVSEDEMVNLNNGGKLTANVLPRGDGFSYALMTQGCLEDIENSIQT